MHAHFNTCMRTKLLKRAQLPLNVLKSKYYSTSNLLSFDVLK